MTAEDAVAGIAATTTYQGLKVTAVLDGAEYPDGVEISDERMKYLQERIVDRQGTHGEWNYTVRPVPRPGPEPGRNPAAGRTPPCPQAWPPWPASATPRLLAAVAVPWQAAREQRLHLARGASRTKNSGAPPGSSCSGRSRLLRPPPAAGLTWDMLGQLRSDRTTISAAACGVILFPGERWHHCSRQRSGPPLPAGPTGRARGITITGTTAPSRTRNTNQDDMPRLTTKKTTRR